MVFVLSLPAPRVRLDGRSPSVSVPDIEAARAHRRTSPELMPMRLRAALSDYCGAGSPQSSGRRIRVTQKATSSAVSAR